MWSEERIVRVGPEDQLRREIPDARFVDAHGGLIMPGFVNLHHHFYSALARGLSPGTELRNFTEVLDRLWWRLDRALDRETVRVSAQLSAADCIRWGCTTVFDHHASPTCVAGSLALIAGILEEAGLSAVLCYEITDRNGHDEAIAGIEENQAFIAEHLRHPRVRGVCGLHASFTLRDDTLAAVAKCRPEGSGCHIHVAEDPVDVEESTAPEPHVEEPAREPVEQVQAEAPTEEAGREEPAASMELDREFESPGNRDSDEPPAVRSINLDIDAGEVEDRPAWELPDDVDEIIERFNAMHRIVFRAIRAEIGAGAVNFVRSCCGDMTGKAVDPVAGVDLYVDGSWDADGLKLVVVEKRIEEPWPVYQAVLDREFVTLLPILGESQAAQLKQRIWEVQQSQS